MIKLYEEYNYYTEIDQSTWLNTLFTNRERIEGDEFDNREIFRIKSYIPDIEIKSSLSNSGPTYLFSRNGFTIIKLKDEWFYVRFISNSFDIHQYYKCDQIDGVTHLLNDLYTNGLFY